MPLIAAASLVIAGCSAYRPTRTSAPVAPLPGARVAEPTPPQLIRKGKMDVTVEHVDDSRQRLEKAASALGAQLQHLDAHGADHADYLFRVPPDNLGSLMDSAATLGTVGERTIKVDDVTEQIVDAEGRLAALRASRDRIRALLEHVESLGDVITVERELARVQAELESLERRLASLKGQVVMSELSVALNRRHVPGPIAVVGMGLANGLKKLFIWR